MQTYREYSPTSFDVKGLALDDRQDWLVLEVSKTRDSEPRALSNFDATIKSLEAVDPDGDDHEEHSFNHWACGYFDIIIVRPGSKCETVGEEVEAALADYPILDDMDCSAREWEEHQTSIEEHVGWICSREWYELDTDKVDYGDMASELQWYYRDRTPDDDDIIEYLVDRDLVEYDGPDDGPEE